MSVGVVRACDVVRGRLGQGFRFAFFKEIFRVHMVAAFSLLVVDVTYFVDQPNFVLPARSISRNVLQLRLSAPLLFFLCIWGVGTKFVWSSHLHTFTPFRRGKDVGWSGVSFRRT